MTTEDTEILLIKNMTLISVLIWTLLCCCFTESRGQVTVTQPGAVSSALGGTTIITCKTSQNVYSGNLLAWYQQKDGEHHRAPYFAAPPLEHQGFQIVFQAVDQTLTSL
ncbi:Ig kappa chain V region 2717 [Channa argus]|uniref:Ig kappa chain V region 2717 n=1 Tax=Channa argus TaxID=215402 RepID=A0A6G1QXK0_CHAAH|nr:Ig kappa chain V region 2717 [Channa argus]